ncbi:MAG: DUF2256 domain-containing protein [Arenicella sp.]
MPFKKAKQVKICPVCQRPFTNRKKWQARGLWDKIIYCSKKCRGQIKH